MVRRPLRGISTLELLIAMAVLTLTLTAVVSVVFGNQSTGVDAQVATEALGKAEGALESARNSAKTDYLGVVSSTATENDGGIAFTKTLTVTDLSPCAKRATSTVSWSSSPLRTQKVELVSYITDLAGALMLGGDCAADVPGGSWTSPARFASDTLNPGKPLALDVLDRIAYIGSDKAPYLSIADTRHATAGQTSGLFVSYGNGFSAGGQINALDAIRWQDPIFGTTRTYVFAAMDNAVNQLEVIDATDETAPALMLTLSLPACVSGSYPQGWQVYAYGTKLYLVTRETAGPELHIFDITWPLITYEYPITLASCSGYQLGDTVEQMAVRDQKVGGVTKRFMYLVTDENDREVRVLDVTNPFAITEAADVDLPGNQDGASLYLVGTKLYVGRQSVSGGPELYVFDASDPTSGLPQLGSVDVGASVTGIRVAGDLAFLATGKANKELQVWNVKDPTHMTNVTSYNFGNTVTGIDYEPDYLYVVGGATPNFQMISSP